MYEDPAVKYEGIQGNPDPVDLKTYLVSNLSSFSITKFVEIFIVGNFVEIILLFTILASHVITIVVIVVMYNKCLIIQVPFDIEFSKDFIEGKKPLIPEKEEEEEV